MLHNVQPTHATRRAISAWWYVSPVGERMADGKMVCVRSRYAVGDPRRKFIYQRAEKRRDARRLLAQMGDVE